LGFRLNCEDPRSSAAEAAYLAEVSVRLGFLEKRKATESRKRLVRSSQLHASVRSLAEQP
jgi:hypothetical protein